MNTRPKPDGDFVNEQDARMTALIQSRCNISRDDLEYLVGQAEKMRDERLKFCIADLIGWGDDERAELETFVAIAIEVMRKSTASRLREAARIVNLRHLMKTL